MGPVQKGRCSTLTNFWKKGRLEIQICAWKHNTAWLHLHRASVTNDLSHAVLPPRYRATFLFMKQHKNVPVKTGAIFQIFLKLKSLILCIEERKKYRTPH
jgi:hypothetical protein